MTRKGAARTQHVPGAPRTGKTEDRTGRTVCPAPKTQVWGDATTGPEQEPVSNAPAEASPLPPPHPALVELVRLLARADARRTRATEQETR